MRVRAMVRHVGWRIWAIADVAGMGLMVCRARSGFNRTCGIAGRCGFSPHGG